MKIKVTQDHIHRGEKGNTSGCALVLALIEATGKNDWRIGSRGVGRRGGLSKMLPSDAVDFIVEFDGGQPVKPCEFDLPVESLLEDKE